jgi:hypothetical protein
VLVNDFNSSHSAIGSDGEVLGAELHNANYSLLKLFALSLLWRASVTSHIFFKPVDLGSAHESAIGKMIETNDAGAYDHYGVSLHWVTGKLFSDIISPPQKRRPSGVWFYEFHLPDFMFLIKVDNRPSPEPIPLINLHPTRPIIAFKSDAEQIGVNNYVRSIMQRAANLGRPPRSNN